MTVPEKYLRPGQVAAMFGVKRQTVNEWAKAGRLTVIRTPGGHHRYRESEVLALFGERRQP